MLHRSLYKVGSSGIDLVVHATDKSAQNLQLRRQQLSTSHMSREMKRELGADHVPRVVPPPNRAGDVQTPVAGIPRQEVAGEVPGAPWVISGLLQYSQGARKGLL